MTLKKLKELLASKAIDQAEYDEAIKSFGLKDEDKPDPLEKLDKETREAVEKMLQSERDRAANKVGNDKKGEIEELKKQIEELKTKAMDDDQRKKYEDEQKAKEFEEQKKEFEVTRNKYVATQALSSAGLDNSEDVVSLVLGEDEAATKAKVATLQKLVNKLVKAAVDQRFKEAGRDPSHGSGSPDSNNPWADGHINYTKQMEIESNDPEKARQLKAAAGIK